MTEILISLFSWMHSFLDNYGLVMIVFTVVLRLLLLPLDIKGRIGMRKMGEIQPKIAAIQRNYAHDKALAQRKIMEMQRKEGVGMMGGCLPTLLQIPLLFLIFFALRYFADITYNLQVIHALEAHNYKAVTDLQGTTGFLWIQNVFTPDAFTGQAAFSLPFAEKFQSLMNGQNLPKIFYDTTQVPAALHGVNSIIATPGAIGAWAGQTGVSFVPAFDAARLEYLATVPHSLMATKTNGLFILPVLAALFQLLQSWLSSRKSASNPNPNTSTPGAPNMKGMMYIFPVFSLFLGAQYSSMFMIYWIMQSILAIALQFGMDAYYKNLDKKPKVQKA